MIPQLTVNRKYVEGMSNDEYHGHGSDFISSSFVKGTHKHSVAKALVPFNGNDDSLIFGDAFHCFMEDNERFDDRFYILDDIEKVKEILDKPKPDGSYYKNARMTKVYKSWLHKQSKLANGKDILSLNDYATILSMAQNIINNKTLREMWDNELRHYRMVDEYSIFTEEPDPIFGLKYRVRFDRAFVDETGKPVFALDWKTCQDSSPKEFIRDFYKYGYPLQHVFYAWVSGMDNWDQFYFVASEKNEPFHSFVYQMNDGLISKSYDDMFNALGKISEWVKQGKPELPAPSQDSIIGIGKTLEDPVDIDF